MKRKKKEKEWFYLVLSAVPLFCLLFLLWYAGKFSISHLILGGEEKHILILNIIIWYVLTSFSINEFFDLYKKWQKKN